MKIKMTVGKLCKGSIRFETSDDKAPVQNVYVSRALPGINEAQSITVEITVDGAPAMSDDDKRVAQMVGMR